MGVIERCWIWTTRHEATGDVQRGVMFHEPQASRAYLDVEEYVRADQLRGAVEDLRTFAQAVLDLPCAFGREGDPLAAQQRRAADLINAYREQ
jgi:hypothetical protein